MAQEVKGAVNAINDHGRTYIYNQNINNKNIILSSAGHAKNTEICFDSCVMKAFPSSDSIKKFMLNLKLLLIKNSTLSKITAEDLKGFDCLKALYVTGCGIEYLPGDLFKHTPHLEHVIFASNKIKYIDEGILEPLQNLKTFNLSKNVNINANYNASAEDATVKLAQLKHEIATKCKKPRDYMAEPLVKMTTLEVALKKEIDELKANVEIQKKENDDFKANNDELKKKLETVSQKYEAMKKLAMNFTIKVNEKHFVVNKALLVAHSEVLAQLITENPEADSLELKDISEATFQEILNFMNEGSVPDEDADMMELFGASCRLKMERLSALVAEMLKEKVNKDNALNVLVICNKFRNHNELKMKAFAKFQLNFPQQQLAPELASQPEKLKVIMQLKLDMDKALADI